MKGVIGSQERENEYLLLGLELDPKKELRRLLPYALREDPSLKSLVKPNYPTKLKEIVVTRLEIQNAVGRLPKHLRLAVGLFYLAELTAGEVAWWLDEKVGTVCRWEQEAIGLLVRMIYHQ